VRIAQRRSRSAGQPRAAAHQHQGDEQGMITLMTIDHGDLSGYDDATAASVAYE
jgi:hypothetical protein